jgi:hypothetical protein
MPFTCEEHGRTGSETGPDRGSGDRIDGGQKGLRQ